jgi:hypothetical protein
VRKTRSKGKSSSLNPSFQETSDHEASLPEEPNSQEGSDRESNPKSITPTASSVHDSQQESFQSEEEPLPSEYEEEEMADQP